MKTRKTPVASGIIATDRKDYQRKWIAANREHVRAQKKAHKEANEDKYRDQEYQRRYGIGLKQYNEMMQEQEAACLLCGHSPDDERLYIDHCHDTKAIRGLLCCQCNAALGMLRDNPVLMRKAADYVEADGLN